MLRYQRAARTCPEYYNKSISEGLFPNNWKVARVAPIYKEGPTENRSNYRPISVLPVASRPFEKTLFDQLYAYFEDNKLFYLHRSGFRALHSVLTRQRILFICSIY